MQGQDVSIFQRTLDIVSDTAEITPDEILSHSRIAEVVDARHVLVVLLQEQGYYPAHIARMLGVSDAAVSLILSRFADRCRFRGFFINDLLRQSRNLCKALGGG